MLILNPDAYRAIVRPLLFRMDPETAHMVVLQALKARHVWQAASRILKVVDPRLEVDLAGMRLSNPIGLAAGCDKDCIALPALSSLGFGYITCGTITEYPRKGNPRPRILRYVDDEALINSYGFPSKGLGHAVQQIEEARDHLEGTPVVASISGTQADEIVRCHRRLEPLVSAIEINISCPNALGFHNFQRPAALMDLLDQVNAERQKPIAIKLPPYRVMPSSGNQQKDMVLSLVDACVSQGVEAITVANTWPASDSHLAVGAGGLSGRPVFADMLQMVADIRAEAGSGLAINASGGIFSGEDALAAIQAGATTVQILTGLVYRGPGIVRRINEQMLTHMDAERMPALTY